MKTVFINGSPKKRFSASGYFLKWQGLFVKGQNVFLTLRTKNDHQKILEQISGADAVVFSVPLYVDCAPSHVLVFLKEMEIFCKENKLNLKIYVISNNGFIEGSQNIPLFRVMENFCIRSELQWCGGIGIGGGVMFNALRIILMAEIGIFFLSILISGTLYVNWFPPDIIRSFLSMILITSFFHLGALFYIVRMGLNINSGNNFGEKYTRILLPSFLFIPIADAYFLVISLLKGGLFKGWLKRK